MLKLLIHIACDECGQRFLFARESEYTANGVRFSAKVLTGMLPDYHWTWTETETNIFHYCPDCYNNFDHCVDDCSYTVVN